MVDDYFEPELDSPERGVVQPVLILDIKGDLAIERNDEPLVPLEVACRLHEKGLSEQSVPLCRNGVFRHPVQVIREAEKRCHVSCINNGLMKTAIEFSERDPVVNHDAWKDQLLSFLKSALDGVKGRVFLPGWNVQYEKGFVDALFEFEKHDFLPDLEWVEMRAVSALQVSNLRLEIPERSEWRAQETCRWTESRIMEILKIPVSHKQPQTPENSQKRSKGAKSGKKPKKVTVSVEKKEDF